MYSPTRRFVRLQVLFALVALERMRMQPMDVTKAFPYAETDGEVYIEMLEGMVQEVKVLKQLNPFVGRSRLLDFGIST